MRILGKASGRDNGEMTDSAKLLRFPASQSPQGWAMQTRVHTSAEQGHSKGVFTLSSRTRAWAAPELNKCLSFTADSQLSVSRNQTKTQNAFIKVMFVFEEGHKHNIFKTELACFFKKTKQNKKQYGLHKLNVL